MLTDLREAVSGQKTYVIAGIIILVAVTEGIFGIDVPGIDVGDDWIGWALNGLGLGTLRSGIAKVAVSNLADRLG